MTAPRPGTELARQGYGSGASVRQQGKAGTRHQSSWSPPHGDAHSPQCQDGFRPSRLTPNGPAIGVKPCVVFAGSEWQDHSARRFGLAAPRAASGEGEARVRVHSFNDALLERLYFGHHEQETSVT